MENKKTITVKVSKLIATCLQRMAVEEIENQKWWKSEDRAVGQNDTARDEIIQQLKELTDELENQGIKKYYK